METSPLETHQSYHQLYDHQLKLKPFFPAKNNLKKMSAHKTSRMPHLNNNKKIKIKIKNSRKPGDSKYILKKR